MSLVTVLMFFRKFRETYNIKVKRTLFIWGIVILSNLTASTVNYSLDAGFEASRGGDVFLMSKLIRWNLVDDYLTENCAQENYKVCAYKNSLPWDFLWDSSSPLYKTGGWEANKEEYHEINKNILTTPKYLKVFIPRVFESGIRQFFTFDLGDNTIKCLDPCPGAVLVHQYFRRYIGEFWSDKQSTDKIDLSLLNFTQRVIFALSLLIMVLILISQNTPKYIKTFIVFILAACFINALICGGLSFPNGRYQSRVVWLLPLPIIMALFDKEFLSAIGEKSKSLFVSK
ncbi:MAG: hypothetical protein WCH04_15700, partial [Gammaproteobacteria bacterium]